ncbi:MAG: hypothetical protein Kow00109_25170 [Acidobacteriota bacterium]
MTVVRRWAAQGRRKAAALALGLILGGTACERSPESGTTEAATSAEKAKLARFWQAFQEATRRRGAGEWAAARDAYRAALELQPDHEESLFYLGNCLLELGDLEGAREIFERLVQRNPRSQRAFGQLGLLLQSSFPPGVLDLQRAAEAFQVTAQLQPEEPGPHLRLGTIALRRGEWTVALEHFSQAAGFGQPDGWYRKAVVEYLLGRHEEALASIRHILEIQEREAAIRRRGAVSEGDRRVKVPSGGGTPAGREEFHPPVQWDAAALQATLLLQELAAGGNANAAKLLDERGVAKPQRLSRNWRRRQVFLPAGACAQGAPAASEAADLDGDGRLEVVVLCSGTPTSERNAPGGAAIPAEVAVWRPGEAGPWKLRLRAKLPAAESCKAAESECELKRLRGPEGQPESLLLLRMADGGYEPYRLELKLTGVEGGREVVTWTRIGGGDGAATWRDACVADLDGDGSDDVAALERRDGAYQLAIYWRREGAAPAQWPLESGAKSPPVYLSAAELDGLAGWDLLVSYWYASPQVFLNRGGGRFATEPLDGTLSFGRRWGRPHWLDWDGDGDSDLLLFPSVSPGLSALSILLPETPVPMPHCPVIMKNEAGRFGSPEPIPGLAVAIRADRVWFADFDGDGRQDLLLLGGDADDPALREPARFYRRTASGLAGPDFLPALGEVGGRELLVADLTGDGRAEIVSPLDRWALEHR